MCSHSLDLMLEDIDKIPSFRSIKQEDELYLSISTSESLMLREKTNGGDLVRTRATRFATAFHTLLSLKRTNMEPLRFLLSVRLEQVKVGKNRK